MFNSVNETNTQEKIDLSVDLVFSGDKFEGVSVNFDDLLLQNINELQEETSLKNPSSQALDRSISWEYEITRNYDAAVEQSNAIEWYFNIQMHILERLSDQEDRTIDLGVYGKIDDHSSVGGLMQLNIMQQQINMTREIWVGVTLGIINIEKQTSKGNGG